MTKTIDRVFEEIKGYEFADLHDSGFQWFCKDENQTIAFDNYQKAKEYADARQIHLHDLSF